MADENLHAKHRARMQERVERDGLDSLAEHEALEYLLFLSIPRADTNALAHRLIQHFGDFCKVLEAEPEELMRVEGVGPKSARLISTVMACSRYYELKKRKAGRIFTYATYAIFTNGLESFDKAYREGVIDGVFGSNLTYRTEELKNRPWFYEVDVSKYIAYFISALNHDMSVSAMIDPHEKINALLERRRRERSLQQGTQLTF